MQYVIIEYFGEPMLVTDESGSVKMFDNWSDAKDEARECQNGIVVPLDPQLMEIISDASDWVCLAKFEYFSKDDEDEDDSTTEEDLNRLLGYEEDD